IVIPADRSLKWISGAPRLASDQVARLVGGDGEQPRTEPSLRIELVRRLVDLEERFLEHVFRRRAISEEADEEVIQLTLIPQDEDGELSLVPAAVLGEQLLVGWIFAHHRSRAFGCAAAIV